MSREQVFVSYSHQDRSWLDRLTEHLAAMERWGILHVWSDSRIAAGAGWQDEIEEALSRSRVAVLLVSPPFLASRFVWEQEMPRLLAHAADGMLILSLVVRPCAWRLEEDLRSLQARPLDGRALSLGSDAQIDLDLATFVYELAALVNKVSSDLVSQEWDQAAKAHPSDRAAVSALLVAPARRQTWTGHSDGYEMTLTINQWPAPRFEGTISYPGSSTVTRVEGESLSSTTTLPVGLEVMEGGVAVAFREEGYAQQGSRVFSV